MVAVASRFAIGGVIRSWHSSKTWANVRHHNTRSIALTAMGITSPETAAGLFGRRTTEGAASKASTDSSRWMRSQRHQPNGLRNWEYLKSRFVSELENMALMLRYRRRRAARCRNDR